MISGSVNAIEPVGIKQKQSLNIFIIGNSFSQNATTYLNQLTKEAGKTLVLGRAELGGCTLEKHWKLAEAYELDPNDPKGKPYNGKSLRMLLSVGTWDIVTIQQYSLYSSDIETYRPYAKKLYDYIKQIQPQAEVVFHQTWAYRNDAKYFSQVTDGQSAKSAMDMWEKSRNAYHIIAKEFNVRIIPVGDAFQYMCNDPLWRYVKDTKYIFENPQYPDLPDQTHSLNVGYKWDSNKKLISDFNHANDAGCFLGSLVWFDFLFRESPVNLKFKPEKMDENFAKQLKKAAAITVKKNSKNQIKIKDKVLN